LDPKYLIPTLKHDKKIMIWGVLLMLVSGQYIIFKKH
jgi:hypothetical protein